MDDSPDEHLAAALLVGLGGFFGAVLRVLVDAAVGGAVGATVPIPAGTLTVNVTGSFLLGGLSTAPIAARRVRLFVATGVLSSFTTYSTFAVQTTSLGPALGAGNVAANYGLGFLAAAVGLLVGRRLTRRRRGGPQRRHFRSSGDDR